MTIKSVFYAAAALVSLLACADTAQAGQLFPPSNLSNPRVDCPSGTVLTWHGDGTVQCVDPTPGINFACPTGQVLSAIGVGKQLTCVTPGGGSGWIKIGQPLYSRNSEWRTYVAFPPWWGGPEGACKAAGYSTYSGACKGTEPVYGAKVQGTIWSNQTGIDGNVNANGKANWTFTCTFGNVVFSADANTEILCLQ